MEIKRYVCFYDDGTIYKITNKPDDRFKNLELDFKDVEDFITGKLSMLEHKVEFDFVEKTYAIKNKTQIDEDKLMWSFLYEIPCVAPNEKQIIITKDNKNKCWKISLDKDFKEHLDKQGITVNLENYYFSVTKKHDPNILYRLLRFVDLKEIPFKSDFEFDDSELSVYTTRRFDSYYYEEVND